jgi:8-oxo-dGTP pyrophosphatase MutT (NUDIX family)
MSAVWRWIGRATYWLAWPALFVYLRRGARTRVLITSENHVLLVQGWMSDGRWGLPGGGLHRGEDPLVGAVRETAEETGVSLRPARLRPLGAQWCSRSRLRFYCHFFAAQLDTRMPPRKQRGEIADARWVPLHDLRSMAYKSEVDDALELLAVAS